jgi:putative transposase
MLRPEPDLMMPSAHSEPLITLTSLGYVPQKRDVYVDDKGHERRLLGTDFRRIPGANTYDLWFIYIGKGFEEATPFPVDRGEFLAFLQSGIWKRKICSEEAKASSKKSPKSLAAARHKWEVLHWRVDEEKLRSDASLSLLFDFELREMRGSASPCLVLDMRLYRKHNRKRLLECYERALSVTAKTLLKWLRLYWQGGMVQQALAPNWENSGEDRSLLTPEKLASRGVPGKKIGGRKGEGGLDPFRLTTEMKEAIWREAKPILKDHRWTRAKAWRDLCKMVRENKAGALELADKGQYISKWQFYALCRERLGPNGEAKRKGGKGQFANNHAPHTGTVLQEAVHAAHQYEIDSTIADIWLVADEPDKRHKIIGKPTVYFIVDRYTKFIVGWYATLDAPSWPSAVEAFLSIFRDPAELCRELGTTFRPHVHVPAGVAPDTLVADRGTEYVCDMSDAFPNELGIGMVSLPAHMCTLHGPVESTIGLHHCSLADGAPGFQPPAEAMKRHGQSYEHDAEWTLKEFRAEVQDWVDLHNESIMENMQQPLEAVYAEIPRRPVAMWNFSVDYHLGAIATHHIDVVYVSLLYAADASVTEDGIRVGKLFYTSEEIENKREWLTLARKSSFTVRVKYDRRRSDDIIVLDPLDETHLLKASLTKKWAEYGGVSMAEAEFAIHLAEKTSADAERYNMLKKAEYDRAAAQRHEEARKATEDAVKKAKKQGVSRTSDRPAVRGEAAATYAQEDAAGHMERTFPPAPSPAPASQAMQAADAAAASPASPATGARTPPTEPVPDSVPDATGDAAHGRKRRPKKVVSRKTVVGDPDRAMEAWDK